MDLRKVKNLIELFEESTLSEMEVSEGDARIRLTRSPVVAGAPVVAATESHAPAAVAAHEAPPEAHFESIDSPMVGTFYNAPAPDAEPFISVGSSVKPGDVLCIIEAMKTFNQIESEVSGTITQILKNNGDPVEYGEPLFLLQ